MRPDVWSSGASPRGIQTNVTSPSAPVTDPVWPGESEKRDHLSMSGKTTGPGTALGAPCCWDHPPPHLCSQGRKGLDDPDVALGQGPKQSYTMTAQRLYKSHRTLWVRLPGANVEPAGRKAITGPSAFPCLVWVQRRRDVGSETQNRSLCPH